MNRNERFYEGNDAIIRICKCCGKVDVTKEHEDDCNYSYGECKRMNDETNYK